MNHEDYVHARADAQRALDDIEAVTSDLESWHLKNEVSAWVTAFGSAELRSQLLKIGDWKRREFGPPDEHVRIERDFRPVIAVARKEWLALNYPGWRVHSEQDGRPRPHSRRPAILLPIDRNADLTESLLGRGRRGDSVHPAATFVGTRPCDDLMRIALRSTPHAELVVAAYENAEYPPTLQRPALYTHFALVADRAPGARNESNLVLAMNGHQHLLCRQIYYNRLSPAAKVAVDAEGRYGEPSRALDMGEHVRGRLERVVLGSDGVAQAVVRGRDLHIVPIGTKTPVEYARLADLVGKEVALERSTAGLRMTTHRAALPDTLDPAKRWLVALKATEEAITKSAQLVCKRIEARRAALQQKLQAHRAARPRKLFNAAAFGAWVKRDDQIDARLKELVATARRMTAFLADDRDTLQSARRALAVRRLQYREPELVRELSAHRVAVTRELGSAAKQEHRATRTR